MDIPLDHIVFQKVALLVGEASKTGFEPAEHVLILIATCHRVQSTSHQGHNWFVQNIAAAAEVGRHAVAGEYTLDHRLVVPQVPGRHGDVPEPAEAGADQGQDLRSHILRLGKGAVRPMNRRLVAIPSPRRTAAAEKLLSQVSKACVSLRSRQVLHRAGGTCLLCQPHQAVPGTQALAEDLQSAVSLPQEGDGDRLGPAEHHSNDLLLPGGKVGKTVQKHIPAIHIARFFQVIRQLCHQIPAVLPVLVQPGLIGGVDKGQVPELLPRNSLQIRIQLPQLLRRHPVSLHFIKECHQLSQEGSFPGGPGIEGKLGQHLLKGQLHHQQLPAGIQSGIRKAAGEGQYPVGQKPEAENLAVAGGGGAAGPAQVYLRLVGSMLRHQQQLKTAIPQPPDLLQHPGGLAGVGRPHPYPQHKRSSLPALPLTAAGGGIYRYISPSAGNGLSRPQAKKQGNRLSWPVTPL